MPDATDRPLGKGGYIGTIDIAPGEGDRIRLSFQSKGQDDAENA